MGKLIIRAVVLRGSSRIKMENWVRSYSCASWMLLITSVVLIIIIAWAKGVSDYSYSRLGESESNDDEVVHKVCGGEYYGGEVLEGAFGALISGIDENGNGYYRGYYESVQMMAQCEAHMDTCQCTQCLTHALQQCPHSLSAQIYLPNCFITYVYHPNSFPENRNSNSTKRVAAIIVGGAAAACVGLIFFFFLKSRYTKDDYD